MPFGFIFFLSPFFFCFLFCFATKFDFPGGNLHDLSYLILFISFNSMIFTACSFSYFHFYVDLFSSELYFFSPGWILQFFTVAK